MKKSGKCTLYVAILSLAFLMENCLAGPLSLERQNLLGTWVQIGTSMTPVNNINEIDKLPAIISYTFMADGNLLYNRPGGPTLYPYSLDTDKIVIQREAGITLQHSVVKADAKEMVWKNKLGAYMYLQKHAGILSEILEYGLYRIDEQNNLSLQQETQSIALATGNLFGFLWSSVGFSPDKEAALTYRIKHPMMRKPDGSSVTIPDHQFTAKADYGFFSDYTVFGPTEDYEIVEGEWIIQVIHDGKGLVEKQFVTTKVE